MDRDKFCKFLAGQFVCHYIPGGVTEKQHTICVLLYTVCIPLLSALALGRSESSFHLADWTDKRACPEDHRGERGRKGNKSSGNSRNGKFNPLLKGILFFCSGWGPLLNEYRAFLWNSTWNKFLFSRTLLSSYHLIQASWSSMGILFRINYPAKTLNLFVSLSGSN